VVTNCLAPLVRVTTVMTDATPMTTPSSVRMERSLLAQRDWSASLKASAKSICTSCQFLVDSGQLAVNRSPSAANSPF
jgi:hypothetical protein